MVGQLALVGCCNVSWIGLLGLWLKGHYLMMQCCGFPTVVGGFCNWSLFWTIIFTAELLLRFGHDADKMLCVGVHSLQGHILMLYRLQGVVILHRRLGIGFYQGQFATWWKFAFWLGATGWLRSAFGLGLVLDFWLWFGYEVSIWFRHDWVWLCWTIYAGRFPCCSFHEPLSPSQTQGQV